MAKNKTEIEDRPPWNLDKPSVHVRHAEMERADRNSIYRRNCPVCKQGILLVRRDETTGILQAGDNCVLCGQQFIYDDIEAMRKQDGVGQ